jgi:hypothetical protein
MQKILHKLIFGILAIAGRRVQHPKTPENM